MTATATTARRTFFALLTAVGFILMEAISGVQAAAPDFPQAEPAVVAAPTWDSHGGAKGCRPMREGELADTVLVVTQQGDTVQMGFDRAWGMVTDTEHANDVHVIGACR